VHSLSPATDSAPGSTGERTAYTPGVRESRFRELMDDEFGAGYAASVLRAHSIGALGMTAEAAMAAGVPFRRIWESLCDDFDVPESRRFGLEHPPRA